MSDILVVDDDTSIVKVLSLRLEAGGHNVSVAGSIKEALALANNASFDLALLDYKLGDGNGIMLMQELKKIIPGLQIIILTAYGTIKNAVRAMEKGAFTYITKPFDDTELMLQVKNGLEKNSLQREVKNLRSIVSSQLGFKNIICRSQAMLNVLTVVKQAAITDSTVLLSGESGTGKELIAKSVHLASARKDQPLVAVNCAALPENLIESELFGYEKGAFTGATNSKDGFLSQANNGTFFFDEISEIPLNMQVKLLRVLQENEFYPLGGTVPIKLNARIIAASNKDLASEVKAGRFRQDLFYRIHVIPINIPPLRERLECIPHLVDYFLRQYGQIMNKKAARISDAGMDRILQHSWPGNVRELKNVIEYAVAMSDSKIIDESFILNGPNETSQKENVLKPLKKAKQDFEKEYVKRMLCLTKGNVSQAAKFSGKYRADFYELIKKYRLDISEFRT